MRFARQADDDFGHVTLVDFPQFMEMMSPHFVEKLGVHEAAAMVFREQGDQMIFAFGGGRVDLRHDGWQRKGLACGGRPGGRSAARILPIPGLWYGPNYV